MKLLSMQIHQGLFFDKVFQEISESSYKISATQPAFTCSKSTIETPDQCVISAQNKQ